MAVAKDHFWPCFSSSLSRTEYRVAPTPACAISREPGVLPGNDRPLTDPTPLPRNYANPRYRIESAATEELLKTHVLTTILASLLVAAPASAQDLGGRSDKSRPPPPTWHLRPSPEFPKVKTFVEAEYPEGAKTQGIEGAVGLIIQVDADGNVVAAEVSTPAGHGFDEAAVTAAQQMIFQPAMTADGPIGVAIEFEYRFELSPEDKADGLPSVNLDGIVRQMGTRDPMSGVTVEVKIDGVRYEAVTNAEGAFEFEACRTVPPSLRPRCGWACSH